MVEPAYVLRLRPSRADSADYRLRDRLVELPGLAPTALRAAAVPAFARHGIDYGKASRQALAVRDHQKPPEPRSLDEQVAHRFLYVAKRLRARRAHEVAVVRLARRGEKLRVRREERISVHYALRLDGEDPRLDAVVEAPVNRPAQLGEAPFRLRAALRE